MSKLCDLEIIDTLITDEVPPLEIQVALDVAGVVLIIARKDYPQVIPDRERPSVALRVGKIERACGARFAET